MISRNRASLSANNALVSKIAGWYGDSGRLAYITGSARAALTTREHISRDCLGSGLDISAHDLSSRDTEGQRVLRVSPAEWN